MSRDSNTATGKAVLDVIRKFPDLPTKQLARIAYDNHPLLFNSVEAARSRIRYYRGALGDFNRKYLSNREHMREHQQPRDPWADLPEPEIDLNWKPVMVPGKKILCISDIHAPFHDKDALSSALNAGLEAKVDTVLINGDHIDFYEISRFDRDPTKLKLTTSLQKAYKILKLIREQFPDAHLVWKFGNHEERWERYLWKKAPELCGTKVKDLKWIFNHPSWFGIKKSEKINLKMKVVSKRVPLKIGYLWVLHGHEMGRGVFNPVNAARGAFLRAFDNVMIGHYHQTSQHTNSTLGDDFIGTWSQGCLCDLHPNYQPVNHRSNHGFAIIRRTDSKGNFLVENKKIIHGDVY